MQNSKKIILNSPNYQDLSVIEIHECIRSLEIHANHSNYSKSQYSFIPHGLGIESLLFCKSSASFGTYNLRRMNILKKKFPSLKIITVSPFSIFKCNPDEIGVTVHRNSEEFKKFAETVPSMIIKICDTPCFCEL